MLSLVLGYCHFNILDAFLTMLCLHFALDSELFSCCGRNDKRKAEASALRGNQWILEGEIWIPRQDRGKGGRKESYFVTLRQEGENVREVFT